MKTSERVAWIILAVALVVWNLMGTGTSGSDPESGGKGPERLVSSGHAARRLQEDGGSMRERERRPGRNGKGSGMESRSVATLRSEDPLVRLSGFLELLESAEAGNIGELEEALGKMKASGISLPMEEELFNLRAGQLKGAELLAGRQGSAEDFAQMGAIRKQYEGWLHSDPKAAASWLDGLPAGKYRDEMAVVYITASAKDDPAKVLKIVTTLHPSRQESAGRAVAEKLAGSLSLHEVSGIFRELESNAGESGSRYLTTVFDTLVTNAASRNADIAEQLVEDHFNSPYLKGDALTLVSERKAKADPDAALRWAVSMEGVRADVPEGTVVAAAIEGMTLDGLESARQWASTQEEWSGHWLEIIEKRREKLRERIGEENDYDKGD